jgi:Calcium-activated chloride channel
VCVLQFYQRPLPEKAEDIGAWQSIFNIMSVIAVCTNAALICFTMDVLVVNKIALTYVGKLWIFIGFQWTIISIQFLTSIGTVRKRTLGWVGPRFASCVDAYLTILTCTTTMCA